VFVKSSIAPTVMSLRLEVGKAGLPPLFPAQCLLLRFPFKFHLDFGILRRQWTSYQF
jgi:hypothetical protein